MLEMALMGDGVPAEDVYDLMNTPAGIDRAFAKLDTIKDHVVWWEAGAQPPQLLADGEVTMTIVWNGEIFNAIASEGQPFGLVWDGQIYDLDLLLYQKVARIRRQRWTLYGLQLIPKDWQTKQVGYLTDQCAHPLFQR